MKKSFLAFILLAAGIQTFGQSSVALVVDAGTTSKIDSNAFGEVGCRDVSDILNIIVY